MPRDVVGSPSLEVVRNCVDMVSGHGGGGLGLDLGLLEVFSNLSVTMIL